MDYDWERLPQVMDIMAEAASLAKEDESSCILEWHLLLSLLRFDSVWQLFKNPEVFVKRASRYGQKRSDHSYDQNHEPVLPEELRSAFCETAEHLRAEAGVDIPTPAHFVQAMFMVGTERLKRLMISYEYEGAKDVSLDEFAECLQQRDKKQRKISEDSHPSERVVSESGRRDGLSRYTVELVAYAQAKGGWSVSGRERETVAVMRALLRRQKCCPVLVGEAGVGKTSVVEALAQRIASGDVPEPMKDAKIYSLNAGALIGGAKYRGEYEERLRSVVDGIKQEKGAILFVDELHALMTSGAGQDDAMTAGNILKPELASGELKFIGATTEDEYRKFIEADSAMERRFTPILVQEPSRDECLKMLRNSRLAMEEYYRTKLSDDVFTHALDLVQVYIPQRRLPDKVFDVIEEAAADQLLQGKKDEPLTSERLDSAVARVARLSHLPRQSQNELGTLRTLEDELKKRVFGQDEAVSCLTRAVKLAESGFSFAARGTRGAFFFNGPTGVGKTEIARQLAQILNLKLVKFDMSEYSSDASVSKLIGSAPGLVGYEDGGLLVNAIRETPNCVLLLDEIEKAHPAIHRLLLQIMDAGTLTDSHGRMANFKQVYLIMTGNVRTQQSRPLGFGAKDVVEDKPDLTDAFAPEFRSRLTAAVQFKALGGESVAKIVNAKFEDLRNQAASKGLSISLEESARKELVRRTLDCGEGARPVGPLLERVAALPLVERWMSGTSARESLAFRFKDSTFMYV